MQNTSTDIDRLHDVVMSNYGPDDRGVGKTFASCHELCGVLAVDPSFFVLCRVLMIERVHHIIPQLEFVLKEHGMQLVNIERTTDLFIATTEGTKKIRFIRFDDERRLSGMECPIVDFND